MYKQPFVLPAEIPLESRINVGVPCWMKDNLRPEITQQGGQAPMIYHCLHRGAAATDKLVRIAFNNQEQPLPLSSSPTRLHPPRSVRLPLNFQFPWTVPSGSFETPLARMSSIISLRSGAISQIKQSARVSTRRPATSARRLVVASATPEVSTSACPSHCWRPVTFL
jgi:hypothetical protein